VPEAAVDRLGRDRRTIHSIECFRRSSAIPRTASVKTGGRKTVAAIGVLVALLAAPAAIGDGNSGADVVGFGVGSVDPDLTGVQVLSSFGERTDHSGGAPTVTDFGFIELANPISYADCYPVGAPASFPDLLPAGSIEADNHGNAKLNPTVFNCTGVHFSGTFLLTVSLTFSGTIDMQGGQIAQDWPGTPLPTLYSAHVTGAATGTSPDGTTSFVIPDYEGVVAYVHNSH
jgi:hypothetical protein